MRNSEHPSELHLRLGLDVVVEWIDARGKRRALAAVVENIEPESVVIGATSGDDALDWPDRDIEVDVRLPNLGGRVAAYARVVGSSKVDGTIALTIPPTSQTTPQRRLYRVRVDLPAKTSLGFARIHNLSGNGCEMMLDASALPPVGTLFTMELNLATFTAGAMHLRARVVHHVRSALRRPRLGVEFIGQNERQEELIVHYVFARQRDLLRQGLRGDRASDVPT